MRSRYSTCETLSITKKEERRFVISAAIQDKHALLPYHGNLSSFHFFVCRNKEMEKENARAPAASPHPPVPNVGTFGRASWVSSLHTSLAVCSGTRHALRAGLPLHSSTLLRVNPPPARPKPRGEGGWRAPRHEHAAVCAIQGAELHPKPPRNERRGYTANAAGAKSFIARSLPREPFDPPQSAPSLLITPPASATHPARAGSHARPSGSSRWLRRSVPELRR